ncbi:MAG TPA: PAS domain S-box protein [Rectinemataceae bacterium]|nr:PAS domain S-box protein [Rectinemataceae bacterium]
MNLPLRILIVDDSEDDANLILRALHSGGYDTVSEVVDSSDDMLGALERRTWDVITSDHAMPHFNAPAALKLAAQLRPIVPFIIVSGEIDLNLAVSLMRDGAKDYIAKQELPRLAPAIERELHEVKLRKEIQNIESALKRSETRYRRLFETAEDGILILDAETGQILDVNPFLIRILGYSKDDFLGKMLWDIGFFHDEEESKRAFAELQNKGYIRYENLPLETSSGKKISVEFVSNTYVVNDMKVAQCNIRDISEHVLDGKEISKLNAELEQRVLERTHQLEALNKELETFNYSVSHDLRVPLRRIMAYTEALKEELNQTLSAESGELIEKIRSYTQRMDNLISALLDLSRLSRRPLERNAVDLSVIAHIIANELTQSQPERKVAFTIADGINVNGDALLLRSVLENLFGNAWKYTSHHATANIEFGVAPQADGSEAYFLRDDGAGFDMAYADKLFGAFQRLHSEKEFPGIGIGLATVQRIINRHNGRVWAESVVEKSTTFYFTLGKE